MRPVLIVVAGHPVSSFRVLQWLGLVAGLTLSAQVAARAGLDPDAVVLAEFVVLVPGLIAAHAGPALLAGRLRRDAWLRPRSGSAVLFTLPVLVLGFPLATWAFGLPPGRFADAAAVGVAAGTVLGRLGCLLRGCCAGRPARHGLVLPDAHGHRARRVPTQLLDAAWAAVLLALLLIAAGRLAPGLAALAAVALYAAGRFVTDFGRASRPGAARVTGVQRVSAGLVAFALLAVILSIRPWELS